MLADVTGMLSNIHKICLVTQKRQVVSLESLFGVGAGTVVYGDGGVSAQW